MPDKESRKKENNRYFLMMAKGFARLLVMIVMIFIIAGRLTYWQGWLFGGFNILLFGVLFLMSVNNPELTELFKERLKPGPGMKWWDKLFFAFFIPLYLVILIIAGLDAGRFEWTKPLPVFVYIVSWIMFILSSLMMTWAMWVNRFFSSVVRIQIDRGHKVVRDGPYRFVRHPGYAAGIVSLISLPLALGSLWGLIPAGLMVLLLIIRTHLEDTTLQKELPGYVDYTKRVRYRLLPGIW